MTSTPLRAASTRPRTEENLSSGKRQRLSPKKHQREYNHALASSTKLHPQIQDEKDEKALMDDLLAGLDADMFDGLGSSPIRPKSTQASQKSPSKSQKRRYVEVMVERPLSPVKIHPTSTTKRKFVSAEQIKKVEPPRSAFAPTIVKMIPHPKAESQQGGTKIQLRPYRSSSVDLKSNIKPELEKLSKSEPELADEDLFGLDFDLSDLSAFDEDIHGGKGSASVRSLVDADLDSSSQCFRVKYPLLNPARPPPPPGYKPTPWARYTVTAVSTGLRFSDGVIPDLSSIDGNEHGGTSYGKTLIVTLKEDRISRVVHLKDQWSNLHVKANDIVNIISPSLETNSTKPIILTLKDPTSFLIHHPDLMLTMTSIANAMPCPRKPVLQTLIKDSGPPSKAMLYGTLLHSLLQGALLEQSFDADSTFERIDKELKREQTKMEVWSTGMGTMDVCEEIGLKSGRSFEVFGQKWVGEKPISEGELHTDPGDKPSLLAICGLHEVEEDIWSPKWGLKGKVDASVQAKIIRDPAKISDCEEHVAPLEIKTGQTVGMMAHRAQTMLYTLLMEDRYGVPVPAGLLYYSQLDSILRVEAKANEIRALIIARNELADWLSKKRSLPKAIPTDSYSSGWSAVDDVEEAFLPPTIDHARECKTCYAVDSCMIYRKTIDRVQPHLEDPIAELYEEKTGHMTERDVEFFNKWDTLLTVEEQDIGRHRSQLWTMTAKEREKTGRCFGDMVIQSYSNDLGKSLAKIHRHAYTFVRAPHAGTQIANTSLLSGHIAKGDPVSLSIEPDLLCLSRGFVLDLTASSITVGVTYVIDVEALLKRTGQEHTLSEGEGKVVFRIDKDEMASGMMRMRNNLAHLFYAKDGDPTRRRLIVDLAIPEFEPSWAPLPSEIPDHLNGDQVKAMEKVMTARDYALILGMPGTGKTTTIAEIIKALVARGKSVLLSSYTHSAVDTILMKLLNAEFGLLRLGNIDKVHPDVQHLTLEAMEASTSMAQLEARLMNPPVVAATCLAIEHPLFFRRKFDYCIVDEASQITLPTCIGPLRMADKFILVGDHFQLPPIVRHPEARRGGLDVSLFKLLSSTHPQAVSDLSMQYRMNEDIMLLSNQLVYEGKLKCGNELVAKSGLALKARKPCSEIFDMDAGKEECDRCWVQKLLDESTKCVFVDTDGLPARDMRVGDVVQNKTEARLVQQLATALHASGLAQEDLAIITPYRQQIKLLSTLFKPLPRVEILTADKSQGRDKECILISLVRSNESGGIGDLLKDWRRINVSFTRAKKKLVIFGSASTLARDPLLKDFLTLMHGKGWLMKLSRGDEGSHRVRASIPTPVKSQPKVGVQVKVKVEEEVKEDVVKENDKIAKTKREKKVVKGNNGSGFLSSKAFTKEIMVS
ncbi:DNA replication ATP-dependent helicase Dna2 [Kwoniella heveanensis CBS 569]|nr:DNA replication ATP-dependent helicase Dna2 [Kwoniella heveanensis CBS 569]